MMSTSGAQLLPDDCLPALWDGMFRQAVIITPNVPEAKLLLNSRGLEVTQVMVLGDLVNIAKLMHQQTKTAVLLKGGHEPMTPDCHLQPTPRAVHGRVVYDVLVDKDIDVFESTYVESRNTHGTGCSLACKCIHYGLSSWVPA